jgi:anti-anti-sigma factor
VGTTITLQRARTRARVSVVGALELATRDRFLAEVETAVAGATLLELDLRRLEYIDSVGISALIEANRHAIASTGARARLLISDEGAVRKMLELTLLHLTLDVRVG